MLKLCVKDWAEEDRPREKLLLKGVHTLTDAELLAIIIGSGNREETAVELAQRILYCSGNNLQQLARLSVKQLCSGFKGIGEAKAIGIVAALELGKRRKSSEIPLAPRIACSQDIYNYFNPVLSDIPHEEFWALYLDRGLRVIDKVRISQGGVSNTVVDIRMILKEAIIRLASGIVLSHNHPSGNHRPSPDDDRITFRIKQTAETMDISLIDHLVFCDHSYYSYADEGRI